MALGPVMTVMDASNRPQPWARVNVIDTICHLSITFAIGETTSETPPSEEPMKLVRGVCI